MKNLVIVESPAKAKTIEGYLGKDFVVKSSYGHVRDLPDKGLGIDIKNNFKPQYEINEDKKETIAQLQKLSKDADTVWLASDDDREGEAIAWHLKETLGLNENNSKRIVFREITKKAIEKAIQNPRSIDIDLVNSQQARRVLDRLVGYELSPVLWKKIKTGLSAGRVQSVAVRLIVEREREIEAFKSKFTFNVKAIFLLEGNKKLVAELPHKFETEKEAEDFLKSCIGATYSISNLETKDAQKYPAPPFTTSTLQQEASRKLSFSVSKTMLVAQKLYESGKITYMRTDSVNLSDDAIEDAKKEILSAYGEKYARPYKYRTKSDSAQEAHEAIRPTNFAIHSVEGDSDEKKLYDLIWKRAIASQMAPAQLERTIVSIEISTNKQKLQATGEVIKFDGFLKVYIESTDEVDEESENEILLPPLKIGQVLDLKEINATQRFSRPAPRYTEASLVKKLEELGIGRPSTYAPTITTIQKRNYVVKDNREGKERDFTIITLANDQISKITQKETYGAEKAKLFPTDLAMVVNDFLVSNFKEIVDYQFTARVEKEFDDIAEGKLDWSVMMANFYEHFHKTVETSESISRKDINSTRELGIDPESGKPVFAKLGKFGAYVQIGENEDVSGEKPKYAKLKSGQLLEALSLEDALELFKLPKLVGEYEGSEMIVNTGKFGPYVLHNKKYYSLAKTDDPLELTAERAIQIIEEKRKADSQKLIKEFSENHDVKILNGRYGPYIAVGKKNVKIPKDKKPDELTLEDCLALAEATTEPSSKKRKFIKKK